MINTSEVTEINNTSADSELNILENLRSWDLAKISRQNFIKAHFPIKSKSEIFKTCDEISKFFNEKLSNDACALIKMKLCCRCIEDPEKLCNYYFNRLLLYHTIKGRDRKTRIGVKKISIYIERMVSLIKEYNSNYLQYRGAEK